MLYIVGTSIGNLEDTSLRAIKTLCNSEIILTEDTRTFDSYYSRAAAQFNLSPIKNQKIVHYHAENEFMMMPIVIEWLKEGKSISLVSESGLPGISDPGGQLIKYLSEHEIAYTVIPGPTAFATAALLSGSPTDQLLFLGFLPKKKSMIVQIFNQLRSIKSKQLNPTIIFYESPHRINATLAILSEILPQADIAICREMSKKFEEVLRGKANELKDKAYKGELTIVIKNN